MKSNKGLRVSRQTQTKRADAKLRLQIFDRYADPDLNVNAQIRAFAVLFDYLKHGKVPPTAEMLKPRLVDKNG